MSDPTSKSHPHCGMDMGTPPPKRYRADRRRYQYRLRTVFLILLLVSLGLGFFSKRLQRARMHRTAATAIAAAGGEVRGSTHQTTVPRPTRLERLVGSDVLNRPSYVRIRSEDQLDSVIQLARVEELDLAGVPISETGAGKIERLPELRSLRLDGSTISDGAFRHVGAVSGLENLYLGTAWKLTDEGLIHLRGLQRLRTLGLPRQATDRSLETVGSLVQLERLFLGGARISDDGLGHLENLTRLQVFSLHGRDISSRGLEHLGRLVQLRELDLSDTKVTDDGLVRLRGLTALVSLNLQRTHVSGEGFVYLRDLPHLKFLLLSGTPVNDSGLVHVAAIRSFVSVSLSGTKITDAGLAHLERLSGAHSIHLRCTAVTRAGIERLGRALPKAQIYGDELELAGPPRGVWPVE
jgi:internalin A